MAVARWALVTQGAGVSAVLLGERKDRLLGLRSS